VKAQHQTDLRAVLADSFVRAAVGNETDNLVFGSDCLVCGITLVSVTTHVAWLPAIFFNFRCCRGSSLRSSLTDVEGDWPE
jgi:hypothetical protein